GLARAETVLERHNLLSDWLIRLGVSEDVAREDACRIEHDISDETFNVLKNTCLKND
ncbi:MAG: metal-dependent transcriptional regulator, partial [Clostridia bacterium]|nr:metal-dependent transcriptional regulator [Clostridia bacterium]